MIQYFPKIEEDQLLYDVISKYHRHTLSDNQQTCKDLFGRKLRHVHQLFPGDLKSLGERLGHIIKMDINEVIQHLTVLPTYSSFLTEQEYQIFTDAMITLRNRAALSKLFYTKKYHLKFCPLCIEEDRVESRETYWRRSHQIPSIPICTKHDCFLYTWAPLKSTTKQMVNFYCADHVLKKKYVEKLNTDINLYSDVSKLISLLNSPQYNSMSREMILVKAMNVGFYRARASQKVLNYSQLRLFLKYIKPLKTHQQITDRAIELWLRALPYTASKRSIKPLMTLQLLSFFKNQAVS